MKSKTEWVHELQACNNDPQKLQRVISAIQADAACTGMDHALTFALGTVTQSLARTDRKMTALKGQ